MFIRKTGDTTGHDLKPTWEIESVRLHTVKNMEPFKVEQRTLPHAGNIPGGRGHKKIVVPKGTQVWCITHGHQIFLDVLFE